MIERPHPELAMRSLVAGLAAVSLLGFAAARPAVAQSSEYAGSWEASVPNGGKVTLVLRQEGRRITGTLSGNGSTFTVEAEVAADGGFYGTARAREGAVFIGGERQGAALGLALADLNSAGMPDLRSAQELRLTRSSVVASAPADAPAGGSTGAGAPAGNAPAASANPNAAPGGTTALGTTPADQQIAQLLVSSPWCNMQYSQQMGATTIERVVFSRDGRVTSGTQRESAVNNQYGSYYGRSNDGTQGFWRVQNGNLMLSGDGQAYQPNRLVISRNSNGYPIVTSGTKEYYQCN
jgi:hypothetical protein